MAKSEELNQILKNPVPKLTEIFHALKKKYGDARRTTITRPSLKPRKRKRN